MKLNLGSGNAAIPGYDNYDKRTNGKVAYPLQVPDGSVEVIRASHLLEHFGRAEVQAVVNDWYRALAIGGTLEISVPDFDKIVELRTTDPNWRHYAMGGQVHEDDFHKTLFDSALLRHVLERAGFDDIQPWEGDRRDTSSHVCSLNLKAVKRRQGNLAVADDSQSADIVQLRVVAIMSLPRYGLNSHWGCCGEAFRKLNISLVPSIGPFWDQCMQKPFEWVLENDCDILITSDYDSLYNADMVQSLIQQLVSRPDIDALAALQCRRNKYGALAHIKDQTEVTVEGQPVRVDSAHFGLTVIRCNKLRCTPKPWFQGVPNPETGVYDDKRIDADIWFWKQWKEAGHSVFLDPNVRIGHIEEMVSLYDEKLEPSHIHIDAWKDRFAGMARNLHGDGKHEEVRTP